MATPAPPNLPDPEAALSEIREEAASIGFEKIGIAPVGDSGEGDRLREWLRRGMHGEMAYMARDPEGRADPSRRHPWARTMICVARSYSHVRPDPGPARGRVAMYAGGTEDYHDWMGDDLERLARFLRDRHGARTRIAVDSAPILERPHARDAGLGWVGKHTLLLARDLGSWFFLGEILTDLPLPIASAPARDHCGACTRCLDHCPTRAIVAPRLLDARLCLSYLTIEHRGVIDRELRPLLGNWIFGCDVCQEVCPWNKFARPSRAPGMDPRPDLAALDPAAILEMTPAAFRERFRRTALWRAHRDGLLRNAAIVLGNARSARAIAPLARGLADPSWLVRLHAAWGLAHTAARKAWAGEARAALEARRGVEPDDRVVSEIAWALAHLAGGV